MRVHISDVRTGDRLLEDIFNPYGLHVLSKGTTLNERDLALLLQHHIDYLNIERRAAGTAALDAAAERIRETMMPAYRNAVDGSGELFRQAMQEGGIDESDVDMSFTPLVRQFQRESDVVSLLLVLGGENSDTYRHSVQVGMLSYFIASWLGWSEENAIRAGKAGLLHDIGKCRIAESIVNKSGGLTEEEEAELRKHPQYGYEILSSSIPDDAVALAALQHHERMNGQGYPSGLAADAVHPIAKAVAVANVYSTMVSGTGGGGKKDLLDVLRTLYGMSFGELDPHMTHTFIRHMLPKFIGKKADLSTGEQGMIVMNHPTEFFRPLVWVGEQFVDLSAYPEIEIRKVHL
jgi:putative nucleotidyltransferase with HDIG domain